MARNSSNNKKNNNPRNQPRDQVVRRNAPVSHFTGRARQAMEDKYFNCDTPPVCFPSSKDHPVYFLKYNLGFEDVPIHSAAVEYRKIVREFISHWQDKGKEEECLIVILRQIYFMERDHQMRHVVDELERVTRSMYSPLLLRRFRCVFEDSGVCVKILLPSKWPLLKLEELFLSLRNTNVPKSKAWKSSKQMTIFLERAIPGSPTDKLPSDDEDDDDDDDNEDEAQAEGGVTPIAKRYMETIIVNDNNNSISSILEETPECCISFSIKKELPIERKIYFGASGFRTAISRLAEIVERENWGADNWVLRNFVNQTVIRQLRDDHLVPYESEGKSLYGCHLNLLKREGSPVIMLLKKYSMFVDPPMYEFVGFLHTMSSQAEDLERKFPRPKWTVSKDDLFFDPALQFRCNYNHILDTNQARIRKCYSSPYPEENPPSLATVCDWFTSQMSTQIRRARYDYRWTVPQIFNDNDIQLLLPIYRDQVIVLVITLTKEKDDKGVLFYKVHTILEPSWAYGNARVVGPIQQTWLFSSLACEVKELLSSSDDDDGGNDDDDVDGGDDGSDANSTSDSSSV